MNAKQQEACEAVQSGKNILLTGSAGTGKSFTIKHIINYLTETNKKYAITATTGTAAVLIEGQTLHSFMGIGLGNENILETIKRIRRYPSILRELQELEVLIIDEISMLDADLFDKVSEVLAIIKANHLKKQDLLDVPFGGIQVILVGDFCQLSPVRGFFCFLSKTWDKMNIHIVVLEDLVRQEGDVLFQKLLQIVRKGKCTDNIMKVLLKLKDTKFPDDIQPTRLYPVNVDVDKINAEEVYKLRKLGNPTIVYRAKASINNENIKAKYDVQLTDEAQVMITRNIDVNEGLVNGKRGVIAYLDSEFVLVKDVVGKVYKIEYFRDYCNNDYKSWIDHMPLKICYALSIHKSQGMTIDAIEIDLGKNIFTAGQAYTALSRAKSLNSIKIIDVDKDSFKINPFVKKFYESKIGI